VQLPDGSIGYTRDEALGIDGSGRLVTENGYRLSSDLVIPPNLHDVQIDGSGAVVARNAAGEIQQLGTLQLARFPNAAGLSAIGRNLFQSTTASGPPVVGDPGSNGLGDLVAGALESSNVDVAEEMTKMIEAQRAYEMSVKAVQTLDQMLGMVNSMRA
jgi:flagellar basal-body rod protein FlgG